MKCKEIVNQRWLWCSIEALKVVRFAIEYWRTAWVAIVASKFVVAVLVWWKITIVTDGVKRVAILTGQGQSIEL